MLVNVEMIIFCGLQHGASQEDFIRGQLSQPLQDSVYDFASLAHTHLNKVYTLIQASAARCHCAHSC